MPNFQTHVLICISHQVLFLEINQQVSFCFLQTSDDEDGEEDEEEEEDDEED